MRHAKLVAAALAAVLVVAIVAAVPARAQSSPRPDLGRAASAILIDARDGAVIVQKDPDERRAMASATKLMTALLALEGARLTDVMAAAPYRALPIESKINLRTGERMRVDDLLQALLLESANDAAVTLASGISGSRSAFVGDMNERARGLGLSGTSYANPIGLDDPANFSTARDLAALARRLLLDRRFASIVDRPSSQLQSGVRPRRVNNRNRLVARYPFVNGVKTGHTRSAGYVLVGTASNRLGARVVSVVMGEPSEAARDADSLALLRYGLAQFRRRTVLSSRRPVASAEVAHHDERVRLRPARSFTIVQRRGERVTTRVRAPEELEGELPAGERVGQVAVLRGGKVVRRVPLVTVDAVPAPGFLAFEDGLATALTVLAALFILVLAAWGLSRARSKRRERERAQRRRKREGARAGG